ncbi:MAG: hypothetical protein ACMUIM_08405 [bacterium]
MKKTKISFLRLVSELENDIAILDELMGKYNQVNHKIRHIDPDEFDWASLGYTIHNIYNLLENYFLRVSKFFENDLDHVFWHKELINRMTLEIKDIRPRLFDRKIAYKINELRAFRHIFRYIYQSELDVIKLQDLNKKVPEMIEEFKQCHRLFIMNLHKIASAID